MLLFVYTTTRKRAVIFTCRYFKLSWNTTALSQSNCRNFSCSSINWRLICSDAPTISWLPSLPSLLSLPSSSSLLKVPIIINDCHPTSFNEKYYCYLTIFLVYSFSYLCTVENKVVVVVVNGKLNENVFINTSNFSLRYVRIPSLFVSTQTLLQLYCTFNHVNLARR